MQLGNIKQRLQLLNQHPLIIGYIRSVELLEGIDGLPRDERIQCILLLQVASVSRLVRSHLDLYGYGWLALLALGEVLVVAFDGCTKT